MAKHYTHEIASELLAEVGSNASDTAKALQLPSDGHGNATLSRKEFVAFVRRKSYEDPAFFGTVLDRIAPAGATLPDGTPFRSPSGVRNFRALVKEARPDVYAAVTGDHGPLGKMEGT